MSFNDKWFLPKNAKDLFSPKQEKILKEKYGTWATVHTIISAIIVFIPFIIFLMISPANAFEPTTQLSNILGAIGVILGLVGSCAIGIGLVNIFMALIKQYLGHLITICFILGGAVLDLIALFVFSYVN